MATNSVAHEHHEEVEEGYVFDKKDVVSETETGYIVRHGDHFHFIYKDKQGNPVVTAEEHHHDADKHEHVSEHQDHGGDKDEHAGEHYDHDNDGFVFRKEDIEAETELGYVVRHGNHFHFVYKDKNGKPILDNHHHDYDGDKHDHEGEHHDHEAEKHENEAEHHDHDANKNEATSDDYVSPIPNEKDLTEKSPEVQKYLDYITYAYGVERNTIKLESAYKDGKKETSENATTLKVEETTAPAASTTTETVKPVVTDKAEETVAPATATPASQPAASASEQPHA